MALAIAPAPARDGDDSWGRGGAAATDAVAARDAAATVVVHRTKACCGPEATTATTLSAQLNGLVVGSTPFRRLGRMRQASQQSQEPLLLQELPEELEAVPASTS